MIGEKGIGLGCTLRKCEEMLADVKRDVAAVV